MPIEPGQSLLHYRIVEKIGEGGMGVVWRAVDTTLDRQVAIKLLPEAFAVDADRLTRFEREAKSLAALNHPNIAGIFGLHEADGQRFLAMEYVEGEDLAQRLERGALSVNEALAIAVRVADALSTAHNNGVVHRDLKPANVVLTADGVPKVLDFGLAKVVAPGAPMSGSAGVRPTHSPTATSLGTVAGVILGTAAYMSPEQARGQPVDRRADLWALGAMLFEMLTGKAPFEGETVSDTMASVLKTEPDLGALPAETPPTVRRLLARLLEKNPRNRLHDAADARIEIEEAIQNPLGESLGLTRAAEVSAPRRGAARWLPWAVAAVAALFAIFLAVNRVAPTPVPTEPRRLTIPVPGPTVFGDLAASPPAISPDGRHIVFGVMDKSGERSLYLRNLDDFVARPLSDTNGAEYAFWSPDSRHVGFFLGGKIKRIEIATGRVQAVGGEGSSYPRGGSWNASDQILFSPNSNAGIYLIDAAGGKPRQITTVDPAIPDGSHRWPWFLPDGKHFLFLTWTNDLDARKEFGGIYVASIDGEEEPVRVVSDASRAIFAAPGHLLLLRGDHLVAIPFDAQKRRVTGDAVVVASGVLFLAANGHAAFSASNDGTVVYASGEALVPSKLTWYARDGLATPTGPAEPAPYTGVRLAPDARRAAAVLPGETGDGEIWIVDLERGVRTRLVPGRFQLDGPVWSADGSRVMYMSQEDGTLDFFVRAADGSGEKAPILLDDLDKVLYDWSRDGKHVAYWPLGPGSGTPDIWIYSVERQKAGPLVTGASLFEDARFSPDGRWLSYVSDDSGRREVFVQALSLDDEGDVRAGARWQVSISGGESPHWRDDGREIVYVDPERRVMAVPVEELQGRLVLGTPEELFTVFDAVAEWDATGDHQRFLVATRDEISAEPLHVVLGWPREL